MRSLRFRSFVLSTVVVFLFLSGCGPSHTEISGQVTYNGKTLDKPGGTISFLGPDGIPHSAAIDTSGNYRVVGVCLGENKVAVAYMRATTTGTQKRRAPDANDPARPVESPFLTPEFYAVWETSTLTVVVDKNKVYDPNLRGPEIK